MQSLDAFEEIWCVDFEFGERSDGRVAPRCLVAIEVRSGNYLKIWVDEMDRSVLPPFNLSRTAVYVAYAAHAEFSCHIPLRWPLPVNVIDLYAEFRCATNGIAEGNSLLNALAWFGLPAMDVRHKEAMRELALRGGNYTADERQALMTYCEGDVRALVALLPHLVSTVSLSYALLRGRYVRAVAVIEHNGIPVNAALLQRIRDRRDQIRQRLAADPDHNLGVYDGDHFRMERFKQLIESKGVSWPQLPSGQLQLTDDVVKEMAKLHPWLQPFHQLRKSLSTLRKFELFPDADDRLRPGVRPFASLTGRNQPGAAKFPFGHAKWLRGVIQPPAGSALAYMDWKQQEFGAAAALSGDAAMMAAYQSADPYIAFGQMAGMLPANATKATHPEERKKFKACALGVLFGKGFMALASDLGISPAEAQLLLEAHRHAFPVFWQWSQGIVDHAMLHREAHTVFNWQMRVGRDANPRSIMNFPMQANGAEMMRLAAIHAVEAGVRICTPVHDAFLIEAPIEEIDHAVATMRAAMDQASREVLDGFELGVDTEVIAYPDTMLDPEHGKTWNLVMQALDEIDRSNMP